MKAASNPALFRELPAVDELLRKPEIAALVNMYGAASVTDASRAVLASLREEITKGLLDESSLRIALEGIGNAVQARALASLRHSLRPVINATGVILHTNLGRAPLGETALEHIRETASGYCNLEFDIDAGERSQRDVHVDRLFKKLLAQTSDNAEIATIAVNNNAAAVLLALNSLADGGEVIVSRGELVEIGARFVFPT